MENGPAVSYLHSLLNRPLYAHTSDGRMFLGEFKCTDNESNIILAKTYEYRMPTETVKQQVVRRQQAGELNAKADMTSRFLGLVIIPGRHIAKLQVEEEKKMKPWELPLRSMRG